MKKLPNTTTGFLAAFFIVLLVIPVMPLLGQPEMNGVSSTEIAPPGIDASFAPLPQTNHTTPTLDVPDVCGPGP